MNILLVEDEPAVISVIQRGLTEQHISVSVALDGLERLISKKEMHFASTHDNVPYALINRRVRGSLDQRISTGGA